MLGLKRQSEAERFSRNPWVKITLVALDRHVAELDRLAIEIRLKHTKAIARAEIIRAFIEAAIESGIDLSEADSAEGIARLLNGHQPVGRT